MRSLLKLLLIFAISFTASSTAMSSSWERTVFDDSPTSDVSEVHAVNATEMLFKAVCTAISVCLIILGSTHFLRGNIFESIFYFIAAVVIAMSPSLVVSITIFATN